MRLKLAERFGAMKLRKHQNAPYARLETGLLAGTLVQSLNGETPVEFLAVGDRIITRDTGIATIEHIQQSTRPVRTIAVTAGSLGRARPECDRLLAGDQICLIRGWRAKAFFGSDRALVTARSLVDGESIHDRGIQEHNIIQLTCDAPHILYADGMELGTADAARIRGSAIYAA